MTILGNFVKLAVIKYIRNILIVFMFLTQLQVSSIAQTTVYSYDFNASVENGWGDSDSVRLLSSNGTWVRGTDVLNGDSDGTSYWHTSPSDYDDEAVLGIESPPMDFSSNTDLALSIDIRYDTEGEYDGFKIEYSTLVDPDVSDNADWTDLGSVDDGFNWYNETSVEGITDDEDGWSGDNEVWQTATIGVSFLDGVSTVTFRILFQSDGSTSDIGVAFDNFVVTSGGGEILIASNGEEISNNDTTPDESDNTDFRTVAVTTGSKLKTFTVVNTLGGALTLDAIPVSVSGTNASDFTVTQPASLTLNGGESTTFSVAFNPTAVGVRKAVVSVGSSDSDEDPYSFNISGVGVNAVSMLSDTYAYDFNSSDQGWVSSEWFRGNSILSDGADGDYWHTTATQYVFNSDLEIESPTMDFTGKSDLILYVDVRFESESEYDGFNIQYSDDDGVSWTTLGTEGEGFNWYNGDVGSLGADGWSGDNFYWETAEIELPTVLEGNSDSKFRLVFMSDDLTHLIGVAFDNFMIAEGVPDIDVSGNDLSIENGYLYTEYLTGTDFRNVNVASGSKSKTMTIYNRGGGTLNLTGATPVTISGSAASDFTVTSQPALLSLGFLEETTFTIAFDPSVLGTRNAVVSIANDDSDEGPFTFAIGGTGDDAIIYHNFEVSDEAWTVTSNTNGDWLWGNTILSTGADGSYWHTDPSTYSNSAVLTLESPVIDLTGETDLFLTMDIRYDTESTLDGFKVEYSSDGGGTWLDLGMHLDDINWYNDSDLDAFANGEDGWSGDNATWQTAEIGLPVVLEDNNNVAFRVLFASNTSNVDVGVAFDNFAVYGGAITLPVELMYFEGELLTNGKVKLDWATASETNNNYFEIQRSQGGSIFNTLGRVIGNGTTTNNNNYEFVDDTPFNGINYYRVKQVDYDGVFEIHKTISVNNSDFTNSFSASVYPNPSRSDEIIKIRIDPKEDQSPMEMTITDISGRVYHHEILYLSGYLELVLGSELPRGLYLVSLVQNGTKISEKILKY